MADMAKELIAAKLKLENSITGLVNAFQIEAGVQVNWCSFARREEGVWPMPIVFTTVECSLTEPKPQTM